MAKQRKYKPKYADPVMLITDPDKRKLIITGYLKRGNATLFEASHNGDIIGYYSAIEIQPYSETVIKGFKKD